MLCEVTTVTTTLLPMCVLIHGFMLPRPALNLKYYKDDLGLPVLLPPPLKVESIIVKHLYFIYAVLVREGRVLCMLDRHSAH